ncbi:MAG: outer membrane protein transport protein [Myxococcota bacterium]|nr:outer membrane protein transport protein [Myxococcota bacterium]
MAKQSLWRTHLPLLILGFLAADTAQAAGYYMSSVGTRAYSRGGAFIAGADNLLAMYHNPAALIRLDRPQFMLDVAGVQQWVQFDRKAVPGNGPLDDFGYPTDITYDTVTNNAPPYAIPHIAVSHNFGLPNTVFAFGLYPPYAPDLAYDPDGPQRYSLIDTMVIQTIVGPSIAHRFKDWITVGGGVSWNTLIAEQELKVSLPFHSTQALDVLDSEWVPEPNEDPANDLAFSFRAVDKAAFGWNMGLLLEPPESSWAIGAMVQAPVSFNSKGEMKADFSGHTLYTEGLLDREVIMNATTEDEDVTLNITMPLILKAGVLFRPTDRSEIELASVWQNWSSISEVAITDVDMVIDLNEDLLDGLPVSGEDAVTIEDAIINEDVVLPTDYRDSWSIRLGGQQAINDRWIVRMGGFFETSGIPTATQSVSLVDGNKFGYGAGATFWAAGNCALDFGVFQSFLQKRTITDSEAQQISIHPINGSFLEGTVVGNGTFRSSVLIFGGGLNWYFGS